MKLNTEPQKVTEPERKQCSKCFILLATHEIGMVTIPAVIKDGVEITPEKYYHKGHQPRVEIPVSPTTAIIPAAIHNPVSVQPASTSAQA